MTRRPRLLRRSVVAAVAVVSLSVYGANNVGATTSSPRDFNFPNAIAIDDHGHAWVANSSRMGITEFDTSTGTITRHIGVSDEGINGPTGITVDKNHVWVMNTGFHFRYSGGHSLDSLVELNATTGAVLSRIFLFGDHVNNLAAITSVGNNVWVDASGGSQMVEISNATGLLEHIFRSEYTDGNNNTTMNMAPADGNLWFPELPTNGIIAISLAHGQRQHTVIPIVRERPPGSSAKVPSYLGPDLLALAGGHLWMINGTGLTMKHRGSLSEIDPNTGRILGEFESSSYRFSSAPTAVYSDGRDVWFTNGRVGTRNGPAGNSVTEFNGATGHVVRVIHLHDSAFSDPTGIASNGADLFVTNEVGNVMEFNAATGTLVRSIR